jgi:hypothetical protein
MIYGGSDIEGTHKSTQKVMSRLRELNGSEKAEEIGLFRNPIRNRDEVTALQFAISESKFLFKVY